MSCSVRGRNPPIPPPKPRNYHFSYMAQQPMHNKFGSDLPPPQDSDTDSGICADSDQSSPRHQPNPGFPGPPRHYAPPPPRGDDNRDYLTPSSARRLLEGATISASPRRLPQRPSAAQQPRTNKQFRVRFADQVNDSAASTSSPSSESNGSLKAKACSYYAQQPAPTNNVVLNGHAPVPVPQLPRTSFDQRISEKRYDSLPRTNVPSRKFSHGAYSIEDPEPVPEPPSYNVALQRLRSMQQPVRGQSSPVRPSLAQSTSMGPSPHGYSPSVMGTSVPHGPPRESIRDTVIRHSVEDAFNRQCRNRSASLPRGSRARDYDIYGGNDIETPRQPYFDYRMVHRPPAEQLAGSLDNLQINTNFDYEADTRRRLPVTPMGMAPPVEQMDTRRQPAYNRQRRCRRGMGAMLSRRSASVGRYDESPTLPYTEYDFIGGVEAAVRAQLIALDHRGLRTVLVEKIQPGPFGFYIATGVMNGQRGIFISRVSIASLSPVLSVGDEILYVDDELVKGRTLEYVQSLIAGKTSVVIVLMPSVAPALC